MKWTYTKGLHDLGNGAYAWLAPDGSWGWSNAGLIVDGEESLLVDTLFDLRLTREMLDAMRAAEPRAASDTPTSLGRFVKQCFAPFEFETVELRPPTRTFDGELVLGVGRKTVELILYKEFLGDASPTDVPTLFGRMAELAGF